MITPDLSGRIAFVTGAGRGIGLAIARALAEDGASVALVDLDRPAIEAAAQGIGDAALALTVDITRREEVAEGMARAVDRFGGLDILVNNAGICPLSSFEVIGEEEWDRVLGVNLKGAFFCCQAALPYLRQSGSRGRIINIVSVSGQMGGVAVGAHYAASKAGLIGLSKSLAKLLAPHQVTVNCIAPGTTATDLTAAWSDEIRANVQAQIPLGRFAKPAEIAAAVCFLASDQAAFITGATLDINGGLYLR
jgi:3-oxoacyl-[acyl-carrier protein] reductase